MLSALVGLLLAPFPLRFDVRAPAFANMTYELDIVTGLIPWEPSGSYKKLWDREFLKSEEDRAALTEWQNARNRIKRMRRKQNPGFPLEDLSAHNDQESVVRAAGFEARSPEDYEQRVDKLLEKGSAATLRKVADRFWPQFQAWWKLEAESNVAKFRNQMESLLQSPKVKDSVERFRAFYEPEGIDKEPLPFILFYRPNLVRENSTGQQLGRYSVVQFGPGEVPAQRIDVVLHELCHFFFNNGTPAKHIEMQKRFLASKNPGAIPSFNLLDEALASAFGNGIICEQFTSPADFDRYLKHRESFYGNASIDGAGKAVFGWVKPYLQARKTLFDPEFVDLYINSVRDRLGSALDSPKLYYSRILFIQDWAIGKVPSDGFRNALEPASTTTVISSFENRAELAILTQYPNVPTLFAVTPGHLAKLVEFGLVPKDRMREGARMIAFWRNPATPVVVIVAKDAAEANEGIDRLSKMSSMSELMSS